MSALFGEEYPFDHAARATGSAGAARDATVGSSAEHSAASATFTTEQALLGSFRETGALEPLMKAKQSLVGRFGVVDGWRRYRDLLGLPPTADAATPRSPARASTHVAREHVPSRPSPAAPHSEGGPARPRRRHFSCDRLACPLDTSRFWRCTFARRRQPS